MTLAEEIKKWELDSRFANLTYQEQVEFRGKLISKYAGTNKSFQQASPQVRDAFVSQLMFRPPVLKWESTGKKVHSSTNAIYKQLFQQAGLTNLDVVLPEPGKGTSADLMKLGRIATAAKAFQGDKESQNRAAAASGTMKFFNQASILRPLVFALTLGKSTQDIYSPDAMKVSEWFDTVANQDKAMSTKASLANAMGNLAGFGADLITWYGAAGVASNALVKLGVKLPHITAKLSQYATSNLLAKPFTRFLVGKAAPMVVQSVGQGVLGIAREGILDGLKGAAADPKHRGFVSNALEHFGDYFLGNFAVFGVASVIKSISEEKELKPEHLVGLAMNLMQFVGGIKDVARIMGRSATIGYKGTSFATQIEKGKIKVENFRDLFSTIMNWDEIPLEVKAQLPQKTRDLIQKRRNEWKTLGNVEKLIPGSDPWLKLYTTSRGFEIDQTKAGYRIESSVDVEQPVRYFKNATEVIQGIEDYWREASNIKLTPKDQATLGAFSTKMKVTEHIRGFVDSPIATSDLIDTITPRNGKVDVSQVDQFSKGFLKSQGLSDDVIKGITFNQVDNYFDSTNRVHGTEVQIPKIVGSAEKEALFIQNVVEDLIEVTGKGGEKQAIPRVANALGETQYHPEWIKYASQQHLKVEAVDLGGGKWQIGQQMFDSQGKAGDFIYNQLIDEDSLRASLRYDQGLSLVKTKLDKYEIRKGAKIISAGDSIGDLLDKNPTLKPKLDSKWQPDLYVIDPLSKEIKIQNNVFIGTTQNILQDMDTYAMHSLKDQMIKVHKGKDGSIALSKLSKSYLVEIPEIAYKKEFPTLGAAKDFLESGWRSFESLEEISYEKGYRIELTKGGVLAYSREGGQPLFARSPEELRKVLKDAPTPDYMKDITGLPVETIESITASFRELAPELARDIETGPDYFMTVREDAWDTKHGYSGGGLKSGTQGSAIYRPPDAWFAKACREAGVPDLYNEIQTLNRSFDASQMATANVGQFLEDSVFRGVSKKQRTLAGSVLAQEIDPANWKAEAKKWGIDLEDKTIDMMSKLRQTYEGFATKYDIKVDDRIAFYYPRVIREAIKKDTSLLQSLSGKELIDSVFGGKPPSELSWWARNRRTSDIVSWAIEKDPYTVVMKYVRGANKEMILGGQWNKLVETMTAQKGKLPVALQTRLASYLDDMMGITTFPGEKAWAQRSLAFSETFGKTMEKLHLCKPGEWDKYLTNDLLTVFNKLNFTAVAAFRFYYGLRNFTQIFTDLAPRFGLGETLTAMKEIAKNGKTIIPDLKANGIITEFIPVFGLHGEEGAIAKGQTMGLKLFRNTDDVTRAIAYVVAKNKVSTTRANILAGNVKSMDDLLISSGINLLDAPKRAPIVKAMSEGRWDIATDSFAREVVKETMFDYSKQARPLAFKGVIGKMFGRYGQYPVYHLENIRRGLRNGTGTQKLAFAARAIGITMALQAATKVLGIKDKSFSLTGPIQFTGGPGYQLMNQLLSATGDDYKARQTRSELFGFSTKNGQLAFNPQNSQLLKMITPGGFQFKALLRAKELFDKGDVFHGIIAATSAPMDPDLF